MEIELQYSSLLLGNWRKPSEVDTTQSTVGIDITINSNNNSNISPTLPTNSIPITRAGGNNTTNRYNSNSSNSIGYVAWDFAGQLEYSTLHPVGI